MKHSGFCAIIAVIFACGLGAVQAQPKESAPAATLSPAEQEQRTVEKHTKPILDALKLDKAEQEVKVREILSTQFKALNAWHAQTDAQIKALWTDFDQARSKRDETTANVALGKIEGVYTLFKPQHEKFLRELSAVLNPAQVETVKDVITVNKVEVTFHAYGEIFHGLTQEQNAFILKRLKAAREEAIDAGSMTEKSAFFKKYKIQIEAYLTVQGYDVKQSYREFVAKQKAEEAATKTTNNPAEKK